MFYGRLTGDHLYGKSLYIRPSLMFSLIVSYCMLSRFPRDILDEILDGIESVPETFPTYSC